MPNDRPATGAPRTIGVLTTDAALVITSWDSGLAAMTSIAAERAIGRPLPDVVPSLGARGLVDRLQSVLESGTTEVLASALHDHVIPCPPTRPSSRFARMRQRVVIGPLREDGAPVGLLITIEDVTAQAERDIELAERVRRGAAEADSQALGSDEWAARRAAVDTVATADAERLVDIVISALRDGHRNLSLLSSALQLLTVSGINLTGALLHLLGSDDDDLRIQAALALGHQHESAASEALLHALDDPNPNVTFHAIEALGRLRAANAVERLVAIAESRDFFLAFPALDALARIQDPSITDRILPLLDDPMVGGQAAEVLGQIGDDRAIAPLVRALEAEDAPTASIVEALTCIHDRYEAAFDAGVRIRDLVQQSIPAAAAQRLIDRVRQASGSELRHLVVVLGWLRGAAIERALTHLLGTAVGADAIEAVVRFGSSTVPVLLDQLRRDDLDTRRAAVVALGRIGDRRAVPDLLTLLHEGDRELLIPLLGALARLGDSRAVDPLLGLLGDSDAAVRQGAIGALNSIGHADMPDRIRARLDDPDPRIRESAVRIAGYFGYPSCADALIARCRDPDEAVRAAAIEHVAYLDDSRVIGVLRTAITDASARGRAAAAQALGQVETTDAVALLIDASDDPDAWVRYVTATSLGRHADARALPVVTRLAGSDQPPHVRIAAVEALAAIGGADARASVVHASQDADADVAAAATRALGQFDDPAIIAPLRDALASPDAGRRTAAAEALARTATSEAIDVLRWTAAADPDLAVVRTAIDGLRMLGGRSSRTAEAIQALAALAADEHHRREVVRALAQLPVTAIPALGACLRVRDPHVRCAVIDALGRLSHPDASAYVIESLADEDASVRRLAIDVLSRLGSRGVARRIADMARRDSDANVRRAAAMALTRDDTGRGNGRRHGRVSRDDR